MRAPGANCVVFKSAAFNTPTPKEYFIHDCCFGDDVARWMMASYVPEATKRLASRGRKTLVGFST
jgi:hypothetical protein